MSITGEKEKKIISNISTEGKRANCVKKINVEMENILEISWI
jgi:hypothetical protein